MSKLYSINDWQQVLADEVLESRTFKFSSKPVASIRKGVMYNLLNINSHIINGIQLENFSFFNKAFGTNPSSTEITKCFYRGYADIKSTLVNDILRNKILVALKEATNQDYFTENANIVLRFNNITSCTSSSQSESIHNVCSQAREVFEKLHNVELTTNTNKTLSPCLFMNTLHSRCEFDKLKMFYDSSERNYFITNREDGKLSLINKPNIHVDENIYSSYSNYHSGLFNIKITGVYFSEENIKNSTIKLWANIVNSHLVTNLFEISPDDDNYDILLD